VVARQPERARAWRGGGDRLARPLAAVTARAVSSEAWQRCPDSAGGQSRPTGPAQGWSRQAWSTPGAAGRPPGGGQAGRARIGAHALRVVTRPPQPGDTRQRPLPPRTPAAGRGRAPMRCCSEASAWDRAGSRAWTRCRWGGGGREGCAAGRAVRVAPGLQSGGRLINSRGGVAALPSHLPATPRPPDTDKEQRHGCVAEWHSLSDLASPGDQCKTMSAAAHCRAWQTKASKWTWKHPRSEQPPLLTRSRQHS
jgi:hypothetical protein